MKEILSKQELIELTERRTNPGIIKWLKKYRIPFMLSGEGTPRVNRDALAYIMGAPTNETPTEPIEIDLNFD